MVIKMKVYLDLVFITNFIFDFILLLGTSIILKRNIKIYRIILGGLIGSLTLLILFIPMNSISLIIYKLFISILLSIVTFGYKNLRFTLTNLYYIYLVSIIMGGIVYFYDNQVSNNNGLVFINSFKYNILLGIILIIIGLRTFLKNIKKLRTNYNKYLKITIYFDDYELSLNAFLDTGNKLIDPYTFKPIILLDENIIKYYNNYVLVPYKTCNEDGLLKCIKAKKIYIDGIGIRKNFLVGLTTSINIDGINCILNEKLLEG